jgi:hypothetical protein
LLGILVFIVMGVTATAAVFIIQAIIGAAS